MNQGTVKLKPELGHVPFDLLASNARLSSVNRQHLGNWLDRLPAQLKPVPRMQVAYSLPNKAKKK